MSDSVRPHRRQPTRLPRPWDSPAKNTGVGCHFLLQCMKVKSLSRVRLLATPWIFQARVLEWGAIAFSVYLYAAAAKSLQSCLTLRPHRRQPTRLHRPWDSPAKNTGVGCHFLLQCVEVKSECEVAKSCQTLRDPMDHGLPG